MRTIICYVFLFFPYWLIAQENKSWEEKIQSQKGINLTEKYLTNPSETKPSAVVATCAEPTPAQKLDYFKKQRSVIETHINSAKADKSETGMATLKKYQQALAETDQQIAIYTAKTQPVSK